MKKTFRIAAAGVVTALSVVLLQLGSLIWVLAYLMPLLCGMIMIVLAESAGKKTAWLVYASVSILSVVMLNDKESVLLYILFFGYYPIIRENIDKLASKPIRWAIKLLAFNAGVVAAELLCTYVFGIPFDDFLGKWGIVLLLALANFLFAVYERLLKMFIVIYNRKYKSKIEKYF